MSNRFLAVLAILAVAAGLYVIFGYSAENGPAAQTSAAPAVSAPASRAQMPVVTLARADGGHFSTGPLRGKSPVLVSFFATW